MHNLLNDFDLYLFDFDGLLVDTEKLHLEAYKQMCRQRGFNLDWNLNQFFMIGHYDPDNIRKQIYENFPKLFEQESDWTVLSKEKKLAYLELVKNEKVKLMPGAETFLTLLFEKKKTICVVTHSAKENVFAIRDSIPILQKISFWVTREDYLNPKPSPDGYIHAINKYSKEADQIIGFEDSNRGLKALQQTPNLQPVLITPFQYPDLKSWLRKEDLHYLSFDHLLLDQKKCVSQV